MHSNNTAQHIKDFEWMEHALHLARRAESCGEVPVGAVILLGDQVIGEGWNQPITTSDPTAHAEIVALRCAGLSQSNYRLLNTTLYVTLEPCIMCLGAMIQARIQRLVFAAKDPKAGSLCSAFCLMEGNPFNHHLHWEILPQMSERCGDILKKFFSSRRKADK